VRRRHLTPAQQYVALASSPICIGEGTLRRERLTWRFDARPSPLSRLYGLRIEYGQHGSPDVFVDAPDLHALAGGRRLPHVYSQRPVELCLHLPEAFEWTRSDRLDLTVVPWSALWLFYFEEWLWSDDWKGGGVHPGETDRRRSLRRRVAA
jgi:hypothetical protein